MCTVSVDPSATLQEVKAAIESASGVPVLSQRLCHGARELVDGPIHGQLPLGTRREDLLLVRRTQEQVLWLQGLQETEEYAADWLAAAPAEAQQDRCVVLAAVAMDPYALGHASAELQADREVVLAAVARDGEALDFAAPALQADREFVLAAIAQDWRALQHAAPALQADREVVLAAITQDRQALQFAAPTLRRALRAEQLLHLSGSRLAGTSPSRAAGAMRTAGAEPAHSPPVSL